MILDSEPWLDSIVPGTCWFLMNSLRKRMNELGGRGMWFVARFFV